MGEISVRISDDLHAALETYADANDVDSSTVVRKVLVERFESWRIERALERLEADEVTLSRGAEIAGTDIRQFAAHADQEGVAWVSSEHLEADLRNL